MKKEQGITLVSLVVYVIVMIIVLGVLSSIINRFYENTNSIQADTEEILKFNKFNTYFLKEIKTADNKVDEINTNYIVFSSGNVFSFVDNKIYYNEVVICNGVQELTMRQGQNGDGENPDIIYVTVKFENFEKSINYKVEEVY